MLRPSLASRLLAEPELFIKASFKPKSGGATHLSYLAFADFIASLGYTRQEIDRAFEEVVGFTLKVEIVELEPTELVAPASTVSSAETTTTELTEPNEEGKSLLRLPVKAPPGRYKYTKYGELSPEEVKKLQPFSIDCHEDGWDWRTYTHNAKKALAELKFNDQDEFWHLHWADDAGSRYDFAFWLENKRNSKPVTKFRGQITNASANSDSSTTNVAGILDSNTALAGLGGGPLTLGDFVRDFIRLVAIFGLIMAFMHHVQIYNGLNNMVDWVGNRVNRAAFDNLYQRMGQGLEEMLKKAEELREARKKLQYSTCRDGQALLKRDDPDSDSDEDLEKGGKHNPTRGSGSKRGGESGDGYTIIRRSGGMNDAVELDAALSECVLSYMEAAEAVFADKLAKRSSELLEQSFTRIDETTGTIIQPSRELVSWPVVSAAALLEANAEGLAGGEPIPLNDLQTLFLDKLQAYISGALYGHLLPIYSTVSGTSEGKAVLKLFGTEDFLDTVMYAGVRDALCSPKLGQLLASEIRRSAYTKSLDERRSVAGDPAMTSFEVFQAQQEIDEISMKVRASVYTFIDKLQDLAAAGESNLNESAEKLAKNIGLAKGADGLFGVDFQFKKWGDGLWTINLLGFNKTNTGKAKASGGVKIGGTLTKDQSRANLIGEVVVQSKVASGQSVGVRVHSGKR